MRCSRAPAWARRWHSIRASCAFDAGGRRRCREDRASSRVWFPSRPRAVHRTDGSDFSRFENQDFGRHCPGCGRSIKLDDAVCMRCGDELEFPEVAIGPARRLDRAHARRRHGQRRGPALSQSRRWFGTKRPTTLALPGEHGVAARARSVSASNGGERIACSRCPDGMLEGRGCRRRIRPPRRRQPSHLRRVLRCGYSRHSRPARGRRRPHRSRTSISRAIGRPRTAIRSRAAWLPRRSPTPVGPSCTLAAATKRSDVIEVTGTLRQDRGVQARDHAIRSDRDGAHGRDRDLGGRR